MTDCPSEHDLSGFLNDTLPPDRGTGVAAHVDGCHLCQQRLDKLTQTADATVARYKGLSTDPTIEADISFSLTAGTMVLGGGNLHPRAHLVELPAIPGFDVIEEIGRGGMGVVYKARHLRLNRLVALKMILAGSAADPTVVQRFLFEAEILARVQHPQVVQVYEVGTYQSPTGVPIPYLAMELLEGGTLSGWMRKLAREQAAAAADRKPVHVEPRLAAELIEGVARAVHSVHLQGVVHRDLKPGNILFAADDSVARGPDPASPGSAVGSGVAESRTGPRPKVTDFGLAKFTQDAGADLTGSGQVIGTPQYMAPEQATGKGQVGPAADVYALGVMLFECLSGRRPFEGNDPVSVLLKVVNEPPPSVQSLCPGLNRDLAAVVMRCLAKDPRRRYPSSLDLADDLRRFLERRPTIARPVSLRERAWLWTARNPTVAGLIGALAAVLLTSFVIVTVFWLKAEEKADDERRALAKTLVAQLVAEEERQHAVDALDEATRQRKSADEERQKAVAAFEETTRQKREADLNRARLEFTRAVSWCEEGHIPEGLETFVRAAELAETVGDGGLARAARINLAAWPRELPADRPVLIHTYQPRHIAFFPDGTRALVVGRGGSAFLWDATKNQKVLTYKTRYSLARLNSAGFTLGFQFWSGDVSPDGKTLAAGGSDGQIWVWDADSTEARFTLEAAPGDHNVWAVKFAPDGTLWSANGVGALIHWDVKTRKATGRGVVPDEPASDLQCLAMSADGCRLYTGDRRGYIREWDAREVKPVRSWKVEGWISAVELAPDDRRLAATGTDGFVHLIDLDADRFDRQFSLARAYGKGLAFHPIRPWLLAADTDGTVHGWNWRTGGPIGIALQLRGEVLAPRFVPNTEEFVVPAGTSIHRCRFPEPSGRLLLSGEAGPVEGFDFSPTGDRLAVALPHQIREYPLAGGDPVQSLQLQDFSGPVRYDPAGGRVVRGLNAGFDLLTLPAFTHAGSVRGGSRLVDLVFAPQGRRVFALYRDFMTSWDTPNFNRVVSRYRDPDMPSGIELAAVDVRPDGREVLAAFGTRLVFLDPDTLEKGRPGWDVTDEVMDAKYMPGGQAILIGRRDSVAQIHDAKTGKEIGPSLTHNRAVLSVAASPDGRVLLTGSRDGTARFWDAATGLPLGPPVRHAGPVHRVRFHPRGDQVATGTREGELVVSPIPPPPVEGSIEELRAKVRAAR